MAHIYCQECGAKHNLGAKFCSSCGTPLNGEKKKVLPKQEDRQINASINEEQEYVPDISKLEYEIVYPDKNKFKVEEIINTPPSNDRPQRSTAKIEKLTKEQYLAESLKSCAPTREYKDVDESP